MTTILLVLQFVLAIVLTIAIMLQKSSSIGLGAYSGSNDSMFGAKGPANFLTRFTFITGFLLVINTVALGYLYNSQKNRSVVDSLHLNTQPTTPKAPSAPAAPAAPTIPAAPAGQ
ncbi:MAG: preprotein translocase subunit SecG [Campylobacterales bacterium]